MTDYMQVLEEELDKGDINLVDVEKAIVRSENTIVENVTKIWMEKQAFMEGRRQPVNTRVKASLVKLLNILDDLKSSFKNAKDKDEQNSIIQKQILVLGKISVLSIVKDKRVLSRYFSTLSA